MTDQDYPYAGGNRLENRNTYFYTPYGGKSFLNAYFQNRTRHAGDFEPEPPPSAGFDKLPVPSAGNYETALLLEYCYSELLNKAQDADLGWLDKLLQRFEVTKRIHVEYQENSFRPADPSSYGNLALYLRFSEVLERAYSETGHLPYLNALLKCLDTLISVRDRLGPESGARLAWLINNECGHVRELSKKVNVTYEP